MYNIEETTWIHAEISSKCQAACPFCPRNDYGYKKRIDFPETELTFEEWSNLFDPVKLPNLIKIDFNGNFGDPVTAKDIVPILEYCYTKWPDVTITVSTNGGIRNTAWWGDLARKFQRNFLVYFSIDGLEDTHSLYRINVPYQKVIDNAKAYIAQGGRAAWRMVPFKHNEHQLLEAKQRSINLGFSEFILNDNDRDLGFVFTSENLGYWITPTSNKPIKDCSKPPSVFEPLVVTQSDFDSFCNYTELKWKENNKNIYCITKEEKTFYIAANGEVYPCCFLGMFPKTFKGLSSTFDFAKNFGEIKNNAHQFGIAKSLEAFNVIYEKWNKQSINEGFPSACTGCTRKSCTLN
jgi:MoaA/NifB/PqqE/SkfB family radical SAM enzyme